ncbi:MAG: hypothetical protein ACPKQO_07970 [Nitrososphaeraceae archaeon]
MKKILSLLLAISVIPMMLLSTTNNVYAQENATDHLPKFFAIQHAQSGSLSKINDTAYSLELNEVSDKTILFSDRPDRIVTSVNTSNFIGNWSVGKNSYTVDAPNAVLVVDEQEGQQDVAIIELFNPIYDSTNKALKYDVTPDNATFIDLPSEFGQSTIVIDTDLQTHHKIDGN